MNQISKPVSISVVALSIVLITTLFLGKDDNVHYVSGYMTYLIAFSFVLALPALLIKVPEKSLYVAKFFVYLLGALLTTLILMASSSTLGSQEMGMMEEYNYETELSTINKKRINKSTSTSVCTFGAWWYDTKIGNHIYQCTNQKTYEQWVANPKSIKVQVSAKKVLWGYATKIEKYSFK